MTRNITCSQYTSRCLLEDGIKVELSGNHCHCLEDGAGGIGEWGTGEENSWLIEDHVEGEAEGNHQEGSQDDQLQERVENIQEHQDIDPYKQYIIENH